MKFKIQKKLFVKKSNKVRLYIIENPLKLSTGAKLQLITILFKQGKPQKSSSLSGQAIQRIATKLEWEGGGLSGAASGGTFLRYSSLLKCGMPKM